ncbi:MAG: hypothetical protein ABL895_12635 [Cyclobacteriaceae bacterium]
MTKRLLIIFLLVGQFSVTSWSQKFDGLKIEGNKIVFNDGYAFQTNIYDLGYIGQLKASNKKPFLILTGVQCDSCDAAVSIYIASPSDGPLKTEDKQERYGLPGRVRTYDTDELIYEGRAFWGEVIPKKFGVIWFQKELTEKKEWVESVFFAELVNDNIDGQLIKADMKLTLSQVDKGKAWEIKGGDMTSEP